MAWLALAVPLLFLPVAENEGCIECNVSVWDLRLGGKSLYEFDTEDDCERAKKVGDGLAGLECVEVWIQRYPS